MMDTKSRFNSFYTRPTFVIKTSAEIISEARAAMEAKAKEIAGSRNPQAVRLVHTKRPFTPREPHRILFGKNISGRPPSAISIRQLKFQDLDSNLPQLHITPVNPQQRPVLPKSGRWRLPAIQSCKKNMRLTSSLDNLPEELETDNQDEVVQSSAQLQKPHSSPKERTMLSEDFLLPTTVGKTWITSKYPNLNSETKLGDMKSKKHDVFRNEQYSPLKTKAFLENSFHSTSITEETGLEVDDSEVKDPLKPKDQTKISFQEETAKTVKSQITEVKKLLNKIEKDTKPCMPKSSTKPATNKLTEIDVTHDNQINEARAVAIKPTTDSVQTLCAELHRLAEKDWKDNDVIPVMEKLYTALEHVMSSLSSSSSSSKNNKVKSHILKAVYNFVETAGELLLLHIARVVLMLRVIGQNLSAVCKLIFKISRSDKNDKLFQEGNVLELFVEALGRASPLEDAEACIYGYGALKFLTMNNELLKTTLKLGALELMVLHIKIVNNARMELINIPEQTSHALFQLTGAMRNVASEEPAFIKFVNTGAVTELCRTMELFSADLDLISNMSRTLSIISTDDACCQNIVNYETSFHIFVKLLAKFPGRQDIIVRLGYVLGNLMAKCNTARLKLFNEPGAVSIIVSLLENYLEKDLEMSYRAQNPESNVNNSSMESGSDGSIEDVIIKVVRIIANMSLHPTVGMGLTYHLGNNSNHSYSVEDHHPQEGARFLEVLLSILRRKSINESEELILSTLSTLNNLSFYSDPEIVQDGPFAQRQIEIVQALSGLLISENEDCLIETTRVFGNLTRCKESRDYLLETGGVCQLVRCLERDNKELLSTTTGILVNLMADWDKRLAFKEDNGVARLIYVLGKYGESDWRLANLICQALWNFCIDSTHLYAAFGIQPTNQLLTILIDLLDEERLFGIPEGEDVDEITANSPEYQQWEQFAEVATNLLEKIEKYLETLQAFGVEV